jgi:anti-sigma factor RsiW
MNPTREEMDEPIDRAFGRALWQQCRAADAPVDETLRFLDLAAFAEGGLDADEHDRIAAWLVVDPDAAADVAAARALASGGDESSAGIDRIVARAGALRPAAPPQRGLVYSFFRARRRIPLHGLTQWGSLAAAIGLVAWLGFSMGSSASFALSQPKLGGDDGTTVELFDPATGFLHDLPAGIQT